MSYPVIYRNNGDGVLELHANVLLNQKKEIFKRYEKWYSMIIEENVDNDITNLMDLRKILINSIFVFSTVHNYYQYNTMIRYYNVECHELRLLIRENTAFMNKMYNRKKRLYVNWTMQLLDKKFGVNISSIIFTYSFPRTYLQGKRFHHLSRWYQPGHMDDFDNSSSIMDYQIVKDYLKDNYGIIPALIRNSKK